MLSILIPVRNETESLQDLVEYFSKNSTKINYEVLIINDFSQDDTLAKARTLFSQKKKF